MVCQSIRTFCQAFEVSYKMFAENVIVGLGINIAFAVFFPSGLICFVRRLMETEWGTEQQ